MVYVLNNLIADMSARIDAFPVQAADLQGIAALALGPGGACNVAIVAARLGLAVGCLGELGADAFGRVVLDGLRREGVATDAIQVTADGRTPVAVVLVDAASEPGYLGFPGRLHLVQLPAAWPTALETAQALFVDGWIEYPGAADLILAALHAARAAGVPTFFDPGPGNPRQDNAWHHEAAALATVLLANEAEAARLTGAETAVAAARALLNGATETAVVKRGAAGCVLARQDRLVEIDGLPVDVRDATGAGDSLAGAVIYGILHGLDLAALGRLANAAGAAKVQKVGTGHNVPTRADVMAVLRRFGQHVPGFTD